MIISESEKREIKKMYGLLNEERHTATMPINADSNVEGSLSNVINILEVQFSADGKVKGKMKCGETLSFTESGFNIESNLDCNTNQLKMSVDAGNMVWSWGSGTEVTTTLSDKSKRDMSDLGLLLNGKTPNEFSIVMTLGQFKNNPEIPLTITSTRTTDNDTQDTSTSNTNDNTQTTTSDVNLPENWVDGIMNKGWLIQKGTHSYEGRIPNTKTAIEMIQNFVGANVDGIFGPQTETKVKDFQRDNGLSVDGKVGDETLGRIIDLADTTE